MKTDHRFTSCPSAPHCVSSQAPADSAHYVKPLSFDGDTPHAHDALIAMLEHQARVTLLANEPTFVHAVFRTRLGFADDVLFLIDGDRHVIDVKSESRVGYYDFGVNRRRVERLRAAFTAAARGRRIGEPD